MQSTQQKGRNSWGFSLVELMIVAAALGGLSLVVMNISKQTASTQKKFQTDIDADFITKEIAGILATNCNDTQIIGKNAASTAVGIITDINGKYSTASTSRYGSSQIKINSYEISNSNIGFSEITDTNTETALVIKFAMPKVVSSTAANIKPRRVKLIITKSGANIATCKSGWVNQQDYWTKSSNDIFYNSGNVGIGIITTPNYKLDVGGVASFGGGSGNLDPAGTLTLTALQNTGKSLIGWNRAAGDGEMDFINNRGAGSAGGFKFYDYTNAGVLNQLMTITGSGNVGIGTQLPLAKLHLNGSDNRAITFSPGTTSQTINFIHSDNGNDTARYANITGLLLNGAPGYNHGDILFSTAPQIAGNPATIERMRISGNGNIGIGTTVPNVGLHVIKDNGWGYAAWFAKNTISDGVGIGSYSSSAASKIQGLTSGGAAANLNLQTDGGNLGVGTNTPSAKLDVAGEAKLGNTGLACNGTTAGAMRYNTGNMEFCNGSAWTAIGGSGGGTQVNVYRCPSSCAGCSGGAWGFYGCQGQYTSQTTCNTIEYPCNVSCSCAYVGKMTLAP